MKDEKLINDIENLKNELTELSENNSQDDVDELIKLYFDIKKKQIKYKIIKENLIKNSGEKNILSSDKNNSVQIQEFETDYSPILKKDFKNLSNDKKRKLFKTGLLKLFFRLDVKKYQWNIDRNIDTEIDRFVIKRLKDKKRLLIKLSKENKDELKKIEDLEKEHISKLEEDKKYEKFALEAKIEELEEEINNPEEIDELDFSEFDFIENENEDNN